MLQHPYKMYTSRKLSFQGWAQRICHNRLNRNQDFQKFDRIF